LAGVASFLGLYATQPLLPLLANVFHASMFGVSLTVTASTLGVALSAPWVGRLADLTVRKRVIVWAAVGLALTSALGATSLTLGQLIGWRLAQGLLTPGVFAVTIAYIHEEWSPARAASATAAYVSGGVIGGFSGRFLSGLIAGGGHWRAAFLVLAALDLAAALALGLWLPRERRAGREGHEAPRRGALMLHLRNPRLLATFAVGFCVLFSIVAMFTYVTFYLAAPPFGLRTAALGSIFFVYLVGAVITPLAGRGIDRYGYRAGLGGAMALGVMGAALTLVPNLVAVLAGLTLCSSGVFIAQASATSHVASAAEHDRGLAVGLYGTCYYAGGSAGAAVPALVWRAGGWPACVALVIAVQLTTVILAFSFWGKKGARPILQVP
jgi:MFS transporter, YNFM family, putative membrane transport protein